jgi:hypothetical protein
VLSSWEPEICTSQYEFGARTTELEVTRDERFCNLKYTFVIPCDVLTLRINVGQKKNPCSVSLFPDVMELNFA